MTEPPLSASTAHVVRMVETGASVEDVASAALAATAHLLERLDSVLDGLGSVEDWVARSGRPAHELRERLDAVLADLDPAADVLPRSPLATARRLLLAARDVLDLGA